MASWLLTKGYSGPALPYLRVRPNPSPHTWRVGSGLPGVQLCPVFVSPGELAPTGTRNLEEIMWMRAGSPSEEGALGGRKMWSLLWKEVEDKSTRLSALSHYLVSVYFPSIIFKLW